MEITDENRNEIADVIEKYGRERRSLLGEDFNEIDYLCGAMAVFEAVGAWDKVPPNWVIFPMVGLSAIEEANLEETA